MISAVMSKFQLVGFSAESDLCELMSQAITEDGLLSHQTADVIYRVRARLGIAGAVGQKHAVWFQREDVFCGSLGRQNHYVATLAAAAAQALLFESVMLG